MKFGKYQPEAAKNRFRTKAQEFNKQLAKDIKTKGHIDHRHYPQGEMNPGGLGNGMDDSSEDSEDQILNTKRN